MKATVLHGAGELLADILEGEIEPAAFSIAPSDSPK